MNELSENLQTETLGRCAWGREHRRFQYGTGVASWTLPLAAGEIPGMCPSALLPPHPRRRVAPSQPLPAVGGVGSSWENRLGAAPPLGRGGRLQPGSSGGRRHRCTYLVPVPPAPARPPLPSLTGLPWMGPPSPGSRPCGTRMKTTSRNSGEARPWAPAGRSPPPTHFPNRGSGEEPWALARGPGTSPCCFKPGRDPADSSLLEGNGAQGGAELLGGA